MTPLMRSQHLALTSSAARTPRPPRAPSAARWSARARLRQAARKAGAAPQQVLPAGAGPSTEQNPSPRRPGRRRAEQTAAQPYASPRQRKDTGRWVFSYRNPATNEYVKNEALINPQTGLPVADEAEAMAAAQARYDAIKVHQKRGQHGLTPTEARDPELVFPAFVKAARGASSRPDVEEDNIRLAIADLGNYTEFGSVADLKQLTGPFVNQMKMALLTTASVLIEAREKTRAEAAQIKASQAKKRRSNPTAHKGATASFRRFTSPENWVRTRLLVLLRLVNFANELGASINTDPITKAIGKLGRPRRADDFYYGIDDAASFERALLNLAEEGADPYLVMTVWFLVYTGARRSEIRCIRMRDVLTDGTERFPRGAVRIWNSKQNKTRRVTGMPLTRQVPLFPRLRKAIESMVRALNLGDSDFLCLSPAQLAKLGRTVVAGKDQHKLHAAVIEMSQSTLYRFIKTVCQRAGVEYKSGCHVWRHTYVAIRGRMIHPSGSAVSLSDVQSEIGHVEGSTVTQSIYDKALRSPLPKPTATLDWQTLEQQNRQYRKEQQALAIADAADAEETLHVELGPEPTAAAVFLTSSAVQAMREIG